MTDGFKSKISFEVKKDRDRELFAWLNTLPPGKVSKIVRMVLSAAAVMNYRNGTVPEANGAERRALVTREDPRIVLPIPGAGPDVLRFDAPVDERAIQPAANSEQGNQGEAGMARGAAKAMLDMDKEFG